jgi:radical SAM superfamily enzyme YgiQ (UPF0313 family)
MIQPEASPRYRVLLANLNRYDQPYPVYPLSLAYLSAALAEAGHECLLWDAKMSAETLEEMVRREQPDLIGLSVRNIDNVQSHNPRSFMQELIVCCSSLRSLTKAVLVLGGSGYSVFPRELMAVADADYGVAGEGERALLQLITALQGGGDHRKIPGLVWREADGRVVQAVRSPDSEAFTVKPRHDAGLLNAYTSMGSIPGVQTQRGCALRCTYCTYPIIEGKRSRYRSGEEVVEEMRHLLAMGVGYTFIVDSVFNTSREHTLEVCEALARAELGMEWGCFLRPRNVNRELLQLMKRAGLKHIEFGSDSLSDPVLRRYAKSFTWEEIRNASTFAQEMDLHYSHFLIFGGPGETPETVEETLAHSLELKGSYFFATIGMRIYPDTPLWRHCAPEAKGERASDYLLEPRFYIEQPLSVSSLMDRIRRHQQGTNNWMLGDPPPAFAETMDKLRKRGVRGPMWEYAELMQRFAGAANP